MNPENESPTSRARVVTVFLFVGLATGLLTLTGCGEEGGARARGLLREDVQAGLVRPVRDNPTADVTTTTTTTTTTTLPPPPPPTTAAPRRRERTTTTTTTAPTRPTRPRTTQPAAAPHREVGGTLACIQAHESGGDYRAQNPTSTASGAYQYVNGTWRSQSAEAGYPGYPTAADAPPEVQDAVASHTVRTHGTGAWAGSGC